MALPKLYNRNSSGNCYKIRLLASILDIKLELVDADYPNAQRTPEFLAVNPRGQIPVLVDGDNIFTDSAAILLYLAGSHLDSVTKEPSSLWSQDVVEQAAIVDWLAFAAGWILPGVAIARHLTKSKDSSASNQAALVSATTKGQKSLEILQTRLQENEWLVSGRPTIADIAVFPYISFAPEANISLDPYPAVKSWISRVRNLSGFIPIDG